jgi:hypothetical protein
MLNVVVLPAPFGPSNPTISPAPTAMDTSLTTRRPRYSFTRFSVASSGPFDDGGVVSMQRSELGELLMMILSMFSIVPGGKFVVFMPLSLAGWCRLKCR